MFLLASRFSVAEAATSAASVLLVLASLANVVDSITLHKIEVPNWAVEGHSAVLECDYDLQGQTLYSVKWYKNGLEFYRYIPASHNPVTYYVRQGVDVDKDRSDSRKVHLRNLVQESTGRYRCEVSTEAPSFETASKYGDMIVVVLPSSDPRIDGGKLRYSLGDTVNVNCTSPNSKPATDIEWLINGVKAPTQLLVPYPIQNTSYGLHTKTLGLRFVASKKYFDPEGDMKLKCTASIGDVYWKTNEKSLEGFKLKRRASSSNFDANHYIVEDGMPPALDSPHGLSGFSSTSSLRSSLASVLVAACADLLFLATSA